MSHHSHHRHHHHHHGHSSNHHQSDSEPSSEDSDSDHDHHRESVRPELKTYGSKRALHNNSLSFNSPAGRDRRRSSFARNCTVSGCSGTRVKSAYCSRHWAELQDRSGDHHSSSKHSSKSLGSSASSRSLRDGDDRELEFVEVEFEVPKNSQAFSKYRHKLSNSAEGAAALVLCAFLTLEKAPEEGLAYLASLTIKDRLVRQSGSTAYHGYSLSENDCDRWLTAIGNQSFLARSYCVGATVSNSFHLSSSSILRTLVATPSSSSSSSRGDILVYVKNNCDSKARSITFQEDSHGELKLSHFSNLLLPIKVK